ncbi:MAG: FAD-binding oxidoreductase [Flavobacteriales bacterium]|nr:FAD-binding oxidoreductase [Flavobacteriales bacterium]
MDNKKLETLRDKMQGELHFDKVMRILYATDASAYREMPLAVAIPKTEEDLFALVNFARENGLALIPRAAGTSLAGQVVGNGIVVDVSVHFREIIELNKEESWVKVQPGVIRDDLNKFLASYGLFFGPETSTSSRCMIGGMVGNNSCGARSVIYGSTREHLLEVSAILADGTKVVFKDLSLEEFRNKVEGKNTASQLEHQIYRDVSEMLSDKGNRIEIEREFPKKSIPRRNTGYAIDLLADSEPFNEDGAPFNFCKLIAGSEGTICLITEIKINCVPVLPDNVAMMCPHFDTIDASLRGTLVALEHNPSQVELMDDIVLECTKSNLEQRENRAFVQGNPKAVLMVELHRDSKEELEADLKSLEQAYRENKLGYHFPILYGADIKKALTLRKAGLGLLANIPGDDNAAPVIEDTAVDVQDLPEYIAEFNVIMDGYGQKCVHYAHAGSGEIHLRPVLNMKTQEGHELFRKSAEDIAKLVKKYNGSLSGEHGDGRLRAEFIEQMVGSKNYQLLKRVKKSWDENNIFNPNKIVDAPPMDTHLRYSPGQPTPEFDTAFSFEKNQGILRAAELCNGSGDCRKSELSGGTMCPSFMATKNEKDTTRARANIMRDVLTNSTNLNKFDSEEIKEVMDLCLSCKGCKKECPSNVDVAKLKAEFYEQYFKSNKVPLRTKIIANVTAANKLGAIVPGLYNFVNGENAIGNFIKGAIGFAKERPVPKIAYETVEKFYSRNKSNNFGYPKPTRGKVIFFTDEFTNYNDDHEGKIAIKTLAKLGFDVVAPKVKESGRTWLSKGLVSKAKKPIIQNIHILKNLVSEGTPLVGIEPSSILIFRDEYLDLTSGEVHEAAQKIANNTFLIDEFLSKLVQEGSVTQDMFKKESHLIKLHGHCHQKALSSLTHTKRILSFPENHKVHLIPSGCCGMAGSFGYEKEHYKVSMDVGELILFPAIRSQPDDVIIAAPGTSCRHQIKDGTGRTAVHPVEIFYNSLI